jgi:hypothetical protein
MATTAFTPTRPGSDAIRISSIFNAFDIHQWKAIHALDMSSPPAVWEEDAFRMKGAFSFHVRAGDATMRFLNWYVGKTIGFTCTSWGGNLATSETTAGRNRVRCLFAHT